jgi:hypothetical protein
MLVMNLTFSINGPNLSVYHIQSSIKTMHMQNDFIRYFCNSIRQDIRDKLYMLSVIYRYTVFIGEYKRACIQARS